VQETAKPIKLVFLTKKNSDYKNSSNMYVTHLLHVNGRAEMRILSIKNISKHFTVFSSVCC